MPDSTTKLERNSMCLYCGEINHDFEGSGAPQYNGSGASTSAISSTSSQDINGLLGTTRWSSLSQTFSFALAATDYGSYSHTVNGATVDETTTFSAVTVAMQAAARASFSMINAYTDLNMTESATPSTATMRLGMSNDADGSAYAYFPSSHFTGGDIWFGKQTGAADVRAPVIGNYSWLTHMHEIGHALGLKHGHETGGVSNVAMTSFYDRMEYSIMTYRSYLNEVISGGYQNETYGYAQTFMMYDIAALQHMYGADFTSAGANVSNSTYSFSSTTGEMFINGVGQGQPGANRIFRTVWDGGGNDTYDFSNYTTNMTIDLRPGGFTLLSSAQLAALGAGNFAQGNVYNALQYLGDGRSLIENAVGGSGSDVIYGNQASNSITGSGGNDTIFGGDGSDIAAYSGSRSGFILHTTFSGGSFVTRVTDNSGTNGTDSLQSIETLTFTGGGLGSVALVGSQLNRISNMDGGAFDDVLIRNVGSGQTLTINMNGGSTWSGYGTVLGTLPSGWSVVGSADFTGDGRADALVRNAADGAFYHVNVASGAPLWTVLNNNVTSSLQIIDVGDVLRDGTPDVLVYNDAQDHIFIADIDAGGTFGAWQTIGSTPGWTTVGLGDFNRDGASDVAVQNFSTGLVYYRDHQNSTWGFIAGGLGGEWVAKASGDVNGDGFDDMIFQNSTNGNVWYQNMATGNGITGPGFNVVGSGLTSYRVAGTADVDNDGYDDVLLQHQVTGQVLYADMNTGSNTGYHTIGGQLGTDWLLI